MEFASTPTKQTSSTFIVVVVKDKLLRVILDAIRRIQYCSFIRTGKTSKTITFFCAIQVDHKFSESNPFLLAEIDQGEPGCCFLIEPKLQCKQTWMNFKWLFFFLETVAVLKVDGVWGSEALLYHRRILSSSTRHSSRMCDGRILRGQKRTKNFYCTIALETAAMAWRKRCQRLYHASTSWCAWSPGQSSSFRKNCLKVDPSCSQGIKNRPFPPLYTTHWISLTALCWSTMHTSMARDCDVMHENRIYNIEVRKTCLKSPDVQHITKSELKMQCWDLWPTEPPLRSLADATIRENVPGRRSRPVPA